ncbi:MAG: hypothetical protein GNW80_05515 [Asgard group archaeon]|nr:hypothetical protein [Asgard group archaeon]
MHSPKSEIINRTGKVKAASLVGVGVISGNMRANANVLINKSLAPEMVD